MKTTNNRGIYFLVLAATLFVFASCAPVHNVRKIEKKIYKVEVKQGKLDNRHKKLEVQKRQSISSKSNRR